MQTHTDLRQEADAPLAVEREPPAQGGAVYLKCETCAREVIGTDPDRLRHRRDCPHRRA